MLTETQQQIVQQAATNTVVFACPGSGKTTVLTNHIGYQITQHRMKPESIMAMTFTRQAALDMRRRLQTIDRLSYKSAESVALGTFHAQLFKLMLSVNPDIPRLLSPLEQGQMMKRAIQESRWLTHHVSERDAQQYLTQWCCFQSHWPKRAMPFRIKKVFLHYMKQKAFANRWDFDDILTAFLEAIQRKIEFPKLSRLKFLLVDEFQDTNAVQWEIVMLLKSRYGIPIFVVGDDDQSIYSFRGATPQWLLNFHANVVGTKRYILATNFRSDVQIVHAAKTLIENNHQRQTKPFDVSKVESGNLIIVDCLTEEEESQRVIESVLLLKGQHPDWSIAILARTRRQMYKTWKTFNQHEKSDIQFRTFHDSKGKEWDAVFIIGAVQKNPYLTVQPSVDGYHHEEERRLFYVALTRARHQCAVFFPQKIQGVKYRDSVFISEMLQAQID